MRWALAMCLAACDPFWGVRVQLRDPANRPIAGATVAVACSSSQQGRVGHTDASGLGFARGMGPGFPPDCDIYIAKPGFQTQRFRYRDLCASGDATCEPFFTFDMMLPPE